MTHVLVVEDDMMIRVVLCRILNDEGHDVVHAENGKVALDLLCSGYAPDLILLDCFMPVMDGCTFLEKLPAEFNHTPVVMLSATRDPCPLNATRYLKYMQKPFDLEALMLIVESLTSSRPSSRRGGSAKLP